LPRAKARVQYERCAALSAPVEVGWNWRLKRAYAAAVEDTSQRLLRSWTGVGSERALQGLLALRTGDHGHTFPAIDEVRAATRNAEREER
jgi:hypothetical protein